MKTIFQILAIIFLTSLSNLARTWSSADGKSTFVGDWIEYKADSVEVTVDRGGKRITFEQQMLSDSDIAFLKCGKAIPVATPKPAKSFTRKPATMIPLNSELDVDVIQRALYWNPKTREDSTKNNPYVDCCPPEILEKQANTFRETMGAVMANIQHVDSVSFWGVTDGRSWLNNRPWKRVNHGLLFDRESKPKPSFHAVAEMLKKCGSVPQ